MDSTRIREPAFLVGVLSLIAMTVLLFQQRTITARLKSMEDAIAVQKVSAADAGSKLSGLEKTIQGFAAPFSSEGDGVTDEPIDLHSKAEAQALVEKIGKPPKAMALAEALAEIDGWVAMEPEREALQQYKQDLVAELRKLVRQEVARLHDDSLKAERGASAVERHVQAAQLIALYPMAADRPVIEEAKRISERHAEVGSRIEVIRRQRYNAWVLQRSEETIKAINDTASSFKTADNPKVMDFAVQKLGEVDPILLEPVVAQLYNYAIEQAIANVSETQKVELRRRMLDPSVKRKSYGDF